ncbi:MAG: aminoacyl-tRNA hydrolase [bacterium]
MVAGLGNPGEGYADTRHNVGFRVLDEMAARLGATFRDAGHCSLAGNGSLYGRRLYLAKPLRYMNRSGPAVRGLMKEYALGPEDLLVVHDDLDIDFGRVRLKRRGGDGGHRGLRSIIEALGTGEFARIRVGIGRGMERGSEEDYVLSPFTADERRALKDVIGLAVDRMDELIRVWDRDRIQENSKGEQNL